MDGLSVDEWAGKLNGALVEGSASRSLQMSGTKTVPSQLARSDLLLDGGNLV